ncbi:cytochrome c biogenesis Fc [Iris pallida]|uniref:Cytochrome c biogenesis Fc (Mitochondrion) n=1 Tax=Iris pallida TaxID=29817 RepID=A0AAX6GTJ6_IRIPA|nr:cytochrome c biogenesis Fc [Iris pallida]
MVVPRGTAAPVLLKWFVSRDVPTGAPSSNGTIIPIPIPEFPFWSIYNPGNSYAPWTEQKWSVGQSKPPYSITIHNWEKLIR